MLSWLFKKRGTTTTPTPPTAPGPASSPTAQGPRQANAATAKARLVEDAAADWPTQLREALGDDDALLRLTRSAAPLAVKLAAVEALVTEQGLKQAERDFRTHDRKVHRVAKQRLEAAVSRRDTRARAELLLERTQALLAEPHLPINHVVALDRDWAALPAAALETRQSERFAELRAHLDAAIQAHGQAEQRLQRWTADARRGLAEWRVGIAAAAGHGGGAEMAALNQALAALRQARPEVPATAELDTALASAQRLSAQVEGRLAWFETWPADDLDAAPQAETVVSAPPGAPQDVGPDPTAELALDAHAEPPSSPDAEPMPAVAGTETPAPAVAPSWNDLPALDDGELAGLLEQRHAQWLAARRPAVATPDTAPPPTTPKPRRAARADPPDAAQLLHMETLLQQAEAALAEGQLGGLQQLLAGLDSALTRISIAALPDALRHRHQALWAEHVRLRDWQQWGGGRVREDLTDEAEALARQTLAAADPGPPAGPRLNLRAHAEAVQALRQRWKDLDRLGAAASQELWHRFDSALQAAFQPLAEQQAALKAARQDNLRAREALLATLEALPVPGQPVPHGDEPPGGDADPSGAAPASGAIDWRELLRELDRFNLAWRRLGPVEHTVPSRARQALEQRLQATLARVETPLTEARRSAAGAREALITQAEALLPEAPDMPMGDTSRQVRELQAAWQEQARGLPLPRGLENALWARFKAATDAVFAQRHAAMAARDGELQANVSAREALLQRLESLDAGTSETSLKQTLAEIDRAWRQAGDVPRAAAERMEQRLQAAHAAAVQLLGSSARRQWWAQLDALSARLTLCEAREDGASQGYPGASWGDMGALPAPWEQALAQRWAAEAQPGPLAETEVDERLLQLETALDLPSAPEWQAARRALKLRALKDSLEGRAAPGSDAARRAGWLQAGLRQAGLTPAQRERLRVILMALRESPPGTLTTAG